MCTQSHGDRKLDKISSDHLLKRNSLRTIGPIVLGVGLVFMAVGMVSFFSSFGSFSGPRYFWCCFVGMPLIACGTAMTKFGYMGAISRYYAGETAPVATDTFNYVASETRPGVQQFVSSIREGFTQSGNATCACCQHSNNLDACFCNQCGSRLNATSEIDCATCETPNSPGSKFCDGCGSRL